MKIKITNVALPYFLPLDLPRTTTIHIDSPGEHDEIYSFKLEIEIMDALQQIGVVFPIGRDQCMVQTEYQNYTN